MRPTPRAEWELLEEEAQRILPQMVFEYYAGGAGDEVTLRDNRAAFARVKLRPRMLCGVAEPSLATTALGQSIAMPVAVAPMAYQRLAHPDGELATASACGALGIPMTLSTMATASVEDVASVATGPLWFQLYVWRDRAATRALVERAVAAGATALVVTVDAPRLGTRRRDADNAFALPAGTRLCNLEGLLGADAVPPSIDDGAQLATHLAVLNDPKLTWHDLEWLRAVSRLPIVLKGILTAEDARLAAEHGADAIVVSNHGGRQLDGVQATLDALPEVAAAADGRVEVWMDGGVRSGTDVVRALALGARIVLLGRPVLWGLAAGGEQGVASVLDRLRAEIEEALLLCGCPSVHDMTPAHVVRAEIGLPR